MGGLSFLSILYILLSYAAAIVFFGGLFYKVWSFAATPSPLKIPATPQPTTAGGVIWANIISISTFDGLFKGNKWTWIGGWTLHVILVFVLLRHLRFFMEPAPHALAGIQYLIWYLSALLPLPIIYLWIRRSAVDRVAYISAMSDSFILGLLLLIGLSGIALKILFRADVASVKAFIMGLVLLSPQNIPTQPIFIFHYTLILVLAFYFPFSKLVHAGGIFFSPTNTQVDNPREVRHVTAWASNKEG
ncbi:MAG: respiratory nitrate reductase subunit gamma [Nitrospinota bacterium]